MDCERAVEALIERASGDLDAGAAPALAAHLETCARCRSEAAEIEGLWNDLGALRATPSPARTDRLAARLRGGGAGVARLPSLLRAAAWVALLLGAGWIGRATAPASATDGPPGDRVGSDWLLLLHEGPEPSPTSPAVVAEYAGWADDLRAEGRFVFAEKLADEPGVWLPERPAASRVTGFFVVRALDAAEAAGVARSGPHLSNGGTVEVRRIDHRGGRQ